MKNNVFLLSCLMIIFVSASCFAQDWVYDREDLTLNLRIFSDIEIVPEQADYILEELVAKLGFFPRDTQDQEVLSLKTNPLAEVSEDIITFNFGSPSETKVSFEVVADVKTYNQYKEIKSKVDFPIKSIPTDVLRYVYPAKIIDSDNPAISRLASQLAQGEDDLFVVVHELAKWVKDNVEYNLSTVTADVSQKASWVLEYRQGVCDELTSLFIAMARSLGIPSRFISGISYTNSELFTEKWGPHGWAEVYFPGYGWVSFDVTYGEFGYVDPSHIVLKISEDSEISATRFTWKGYKVEVLPGELKTETTIKARGSKIEPVISISADAIRKETGFGSYNIIEGTVENLKDYYVTAQMSISKIKELEIVGNEKKEILLKPNEVKKLYWVVKVDNNLNKRYIYTFPVFVYSLRNESGKVEFTSQEKGAIMTLKDVQELIAVLEKEETKTYSKNIDLSCYTEKDYYYKHETADIECTIKNSGNMILDNLKVCILDDCKSVSININQESHLKFFVNFSTYPSGNVIVKAENKDISKLYPVELRILDNPSVALSNIIHPEEVEFNDEFKIKFTLKKESVSDPVDIEIYFYQEKTAKKYFLDKLNEDMAIEFVIKADDLNAGNNNFKIAVEYKDLDGRVFSAEERFVVKLINLSLRQKLIIFFKSVGRAVIGFFQK